MIKEKIPQIVAVVTGTIGAVTDGMQYGWTAPVVPILKRNDSLIKIEDKDEAWLENTYMLGGFAGLIFTIFIVDKFGRKPSILIAAVMHLIAWLLIAFATSITHLLVSRFIAGLAGDVAFVAAPMYIAEIADKQIRGFLGAMIVIMMMIGVLIVYSVAPFVSLKVSSGVGAAFVLIQLMTFTFVPESPYYYLVKGKMKKALESLRWLRAQGDVRKELEEINLAVERQQSEKGRIIDLFKIKSNRKALFIVMSLNAFQHFSSISVVLMALHNILGNGGYFDANVSGIIISAVMVFACTLASLIVDKFGRKVLLISSSISSGLSLFIFSTYMAFEYYKYDVTNWNWIPLASIIMYSLAFKFGLGMVPLVSTGELFPTTVKAMGMTISDASYVVFSIISINIYEFLKVYGRHVPFFIFSASCFLAAFFVHLYIPETKGKTLEEIQFILKGEQYDRRNKHEMVSLTS